MSDLHSEAALSSATLMAASPRFAEAVAISHEQRSLGVGCHIVLVDGSPVAPSDSISSLIAGYEDLQQGPIFRSTLGTFVRDLSAGRIAREDIEREATAQIVHLQQAGISVTHVDTHKHTHMFPAVLDAVTRAAKTCGVGAIRNPFEPAWSVAVTPNAGLLRRLQVRVLGRYRRNFLRVVRERRFATTKGCVGVLATGTLNAPALAAILRQMPEGTWELVCHPAYMDEELRTTRTRLQESRTVELDTLRALPAILAGKVEQIHFGQV